MRVYPKIAILHRDTEGLSHDARVLSASLKQVSNNCSVVVVKMAASRTAATMSLPAIEELADIDTVVCLEQIMIPENLRNIPRKILVPNFEWFGKAELERVRWIDEVWHKTEISMSTLMKLFPPNVKHQLVGWTSDDVKIDVIQNFTKFIHIRGTSHQKQSEIILETWMANPEYPPLLLLNYVDDGRFLNIPFNMRYKNVEVISRKLERNELLGLANGCGLHICLSTAEGFGHYINEAKSIGAVVIATDAEPMNHLITGDMGCLVPVGAVRRAGLVDKCFVRREGLEKAVNYVLSLTEQQRKALGGKARISYLEQKKLFLNALGKAIYAEQ